MPDSQPVTPARLVVLVSGNGSNLQALIDSIQASADASASSPARICAVISNRADAYGLQRAQQAGIAPQVLDHKQVFRLKEELGTEPRFWYFMD